MINFDYHTNCLSRSKRRLNMKRTMLALGVLCLLFLGAGPAVAGSITYTEESMASGTVGTNSFFDVFVTLTMVGDTANVTGGGGFFTNYGTMTINIPGTGFATFTDITSVFVNQGYPAVGMATTFGSILDTVDSSVSTYDLKAD